ncbi:MAG: hypothetical protein ACREBF_01810 [Candidatus Micrarchaeales archaeon]
MNGQETVYRRIACGFLDGEGSFTQLSLSKSLGLSLSTVNAAVVNLRDISAVRVKQRSFEVVAFDRLLLYWATHRLLKKDIIYQTRVDMPVREIERSMPQEIAFTGYTAYRLIFKEAPADYSEVYVYATEPGLSIVKKRFPKNDKIPNVVVLKCDGNLKNAIEQGKLKHSSVCEAQVFVDLWNMGEWYAKDYVDALAKRVGI